MSKKVKSTAKTVVHTEPYILKEIDESQFAEIDRELGDVLLRVVQRIEDVKRDMKREPSHALYMEVLKRVHNALNGLYLNGSVKVGETLNDRWISAQKAKESAIDVEEENI